MRSAAARGEVADLLRAKKGWRRTSVPESGRVHMGGRRQTGEGGDLVTTYLESIQSFGLLHLEGPGTRLPSTLKLSRETLKVKAVAKL